MDLSRSQDHLHARPSIGARACCTTSIAATAASCIEFEGRQIYHCGDSAYFSGFREIGRRLAPEIALLPIGAYEPPSFRDVHMGPEQAVQAFHELKSKTFVPMHFGTYRMSYEPMHEPAQRLMLAGNNAGMPAKHPLPRRGHAAGFLSHAGLVAAL